MDPLRAIAPLVAIACFALVTLRGLVEGTGAAHTLRDALFALFLGLLVGLLAQVIIAGIVHEHNKEYARANPVRPIGWTDPSEVVEVDEYIEPDTPNTDRPDATLSGAGTVSGHNPAPIPGGASKKL